MVCSRSRPAVELSRDIAKKLAIAYEEWGSQCLFKAKKLAEEHPFNNEKVAHLESEADYWFGLAEQMRRESNFERHEKLGSGVYRFKEQKNP